MMRKRTPIIPLMLVLGFVLQFPASSVAANVDAGGFDLMPMPAKITPAEGKHRVTDGFYVAGDASPTARAFKAASRFMFRLSGRTGFFFKQDFLLTQAVSDQASLFYKYEKAGKLEPFEDESYTLTIGPEKIALTANTDIGILRGLETLLQLLAADDQGYYFPCLEVQDGPRFTWRGLMIDAGRHFMPVDMVKRTLDGMAAVKLNVLHWHLTEDQGFRVECKTYPKLHLLGSDGFYYTQDQIKDVIAYAAERGIRVMPEFDIPGHSTSWFAAFPEYASGSGPYTVERKFGIFAPTFNPTEEKTYKFFDGFLKEMAGLFPDPYLHIGGDEVEGGEWKANPAIQQFMKKNGIPDNHALQAYFNKRILKILTKYGKKMVGWDEVFQPGLPTNIVIQSWRGQEALVESARKGYQGLLSNGYYIDLCQPAWKHYLNDPVPETSPLSEDEKKFILGGEATMWAELVTPETVDSRIWPRTAAIAERYWSPQSVKDIEDMYRRMNITSLRLEELGLKHLSYQAMLLRRLTRSDAVAPLKVLADVVEPLKRYERHEQATYTSLSPFTRFVDACPPESMTAREFTAKVDRFLQTKDQALAQDLNAMLVRWRDNHKILLPIIQGSPVLKEVQPLSEALTLAAETGIKAFDLVLSGQKSDQVWVDEMAQALAEAKKPKAHAELAILLAIDKLVKASAGL
jgi:hexosaminidase